MRYIILITVFVILYGIILKAQPANNITAGQKSDSLELQKLIDQATNLSAQEEKEKTDISKKFHSGIRQQQGLNPNISVGGDLFGAYCSSDNDLITEPSEFSEGNNGMYLRGVEMSFISALDPFARGKVFLHLHKDGIEVEEAYMEIINLPLNINLKTGIFFIEYGLLNRYHTHALPQFDRPGVITNFFGKEGIGGAGIAGNILLPKILFADASSIDISFVKGSNEFSFTTDKKYNFLYAGHLKNYYDLSESSYFEYTLSEIAGRNDTSGIYCSYISSLGIHYKWEPPSRSKYRTFDWKTEVYYGIMENPAKTIYSKGFYSSFQNKLNARFWVGGRIGYSELPYDSKQTEWDYAICIDFWQSEFVFYRMQYQYNQRDINNMMGMPGEYPSVHSVIFQISWAMGPHKHEAY